MGLVFTPFRPQVILLILLRYTRLLQLAFWVTPLYDAFLQILALKCLELGVKIQSQLFGLMFCIESFGEDHLAVRHDGLVGSCVPLHDLIVGVVEGEDGFALGQGYQTAIFALFGLPWLSKWKLSRFPDILNRFNRFLSNFTAVTRFFWINICLLVWDSS